MTDHEHTIAVRAWSETGTYQAMCTCGWVAEWPHQSRKGARKDGAQHLEWVKMHETFGTADYWNPGL